MALFTGADKNSRPDATGVPLRLIRWIADHGYASEENAYKWLRGAIYESAPVTHPEGNRRYEDLLLTVEDGCLTDLAVFEPKCHACNDTGRFIAHDPDGTRRTWPCPECRVDKRQRRRQTN